MRYLGGHLGTAASALLDGQLDPSSAERAWAHVHSCGRCLRQVEREGWVKTQLARMSGDGPAPAEPPDQLLGSLYRLGDRGDPATLGPTTLDPAGLNPTAADPAAAWEAVAELERRGRDRRRAGLVLVGAGSVSAAVLGIASLGGATLGIGGTPASTAPTALIRSGTPTPAATAWVAPSARVQGRLPASAVGGWRGGPGAGMGEEIDGETSRGDGARGTGRP